jgi:hypothetical protein
MPRTLIGLDYTGTACIKIMQSTADDPKTTPDSQSGKFRFNSKWAAQLRYQGSDFVSQLGGAGSSYLPGGAGNSNFTRFSNKVSNNGQQYNFYRNSHFSGLEYNFPAFDVKYVSPSSGWYVGGRVSLAFLGWQDRAGIYRQPQGGSVGWMENASVSGFGGGFFMSYGGEFRMNSEQPNNIKLLMWNLPADSSPIINQALSPVPGQMNVQITKNFCRVSKPGYDVRVATPSQMAFDSSSRPAKVIAADDILIPSGSSSYTVSLPGVVISGELVVDIIFYQGSTVYFPSSPLSDETQYGADYTVSGNSIIFSNPYGTCRARFIVYAQDDGSISSGSNKVLRQFNDGTRDVVQFLRPGAANPPRLSDIMIDSRLPVLQIVKEGYIGIGSGSLQNVVSFDSSGLFPFIKYWTVHGGGTITSLGSTTVSRRVRMPYTSFGYVQPPSAGKSYYTGGDSSYCRLTTNEARFFTFVGAPTRRYLEQTQVNPGYQLVNEFDETPIVGIRYYIFGIPV